MEFQQALAKLTSSTLFKEWHKKDFYLAHGFMMTDDEEWQIGWYSPEKQKMKTFIIGRTIEQTEEQEVLNKKGIQKLHPDKIKISYEEALARADETENKEPVLKKFFIIQTIDGKTAYNITKFTQSYNTINIRIDAETGEVLEVSKQNLMSFA